MPTDNPGSTVEGEDLADTLESAIIKRRQKDEESAPNRRFVDQVVLRDSSRMAITASHLEIVDQHTGEIHHHAVKIECLPRLRASEGRRYVLTQPRTIWIDDDGDDEIGRLEAFLAVVRDRLPEESGDYLIIRQGEDANHSAALHQLIELASSAGKAEALVRTLETVSGNPDALEQLAQFAATNPQATQIASATLNIARYSQALEELERLIDADSLEADFQRHLGANYWLFGTEYSELLDLRRATRDEQQDFIVRRTTDNYIEIIEIKTPLRGSPLFNFDPSHDTHYSSAPLSKVIGQVVKYIEKLDASRHMLLSEDGLDTNKIRAKIIIGRDGDERQANALRNYNGHLHRIEVITFDQLLSIGRCVLRNLESVIQLAPAASVIEMNNSDLDDLPF